MKVLVVHPPMYPVNYKFYNMLGKYVKLTVWQFGEYPSDHSDWTYENLKYLNDNITIKVIGKGGDSIQNQFKIFQFFPDLRSLNPDIVLSIAFWIPSLYFSLIKKFLKFKFIILTNAIYETEKNNSEMRKIIRKLISLNTDMFISSSNLTTEYLKSINSNSKIYLSLQTIDVKDWQKKFLELESKVQLKIKLFNKTNNIIMLGVGNYISKKNWIAVIEIMHKFPNLFFVLVGDGDEHELYNIKIKNLQLNERVLLVGRKSGKALKEYYKAADFLIFPSLYDQFGFVVPEALCSGLPVICTKNAGAEVLIKEGYNGYIMQDNIDMITKIDVMMKNYKNMNQNAYCSIEEMSLENRALEFYDSFNKVTKQ
ncbi:MAG TPA: glycosyltransferase [Flavobacteriia bacterium]|nr:glycosyltransferase [Flavobacteriia bacterium]